MAATVQKLAELVRGNVLGDGDLAIRGARTLEAAQAGDITFVENASHAHRLEASQAAAAVVPLNTLVNSKTLILAADPLMAFVQIFQLFQGKPVPQPSGIDPRAVVHASASIGEFPSIHPLVCIGENTIVGKRCNLHSGVVLGKNCRLGDDVVLHPNVVLYDDTVVGDRVILHAGVVLGADGFGYRFHQGRHVKVPQLGNVVIGNDVEIGAGSCIDKGAFHATVIGDGTKIDNLVQIAHNCQIGKHVAIAALVGIGGSTSIGNYVVMGGQVGIRDHVTIGDAAMIGAKSGILHDVPARARMFGYPAQTEQEIGRILAVMKKLPQMRKDLTRVLRLLDMPEEKEAA